MMMMMMIIKITIIIIIIIIIIYSSDAEESPKRKNTTGKELMYDSKGKNSCANARREGEWGSRIMIPLISHLGTAWR